MFNFSRECQKVESAIKAKVENKKKLFVFRKREFIDTCVINGVAILQCAISLLLYTEETLTGVFMLKSLFTVFVPLIIVGVMSDRFRSAMRENDFICSDLNETRRLGDLYAMKTRRFVRYED